MKVIFRDGGHKVTIEEREEKAYWMDFETYDAIPLIVTAFVDDYKKNWASGRGSKLQYL